MILKQQNIPQTTEINGDKNTTQNPKPTNKNHTTRKIHIKT
jgi:hypothetical protein